MADKGLKHHLKSAPVVIDRSLILADDVIELIEYSSNYLNSFVGTRGHAKRKNAS